MDMWRMMGGLMAAAALFCPVSCSVKEDRTECPVYVTVLTDRFVQKSLDEGVVSFAADRPIHREQILFLQYIRQGYEHACPRDYARVSVLSGLDQGELGGETLTFPPGRQADLVWAYATSFSAWADEYVVDAEPHKQYCLIRFLFDGSPTAPDDYPWHFRLLADCSGLDLYTLEPIPGAYSSIVEPDALGEWYGVLPRQHGNTMKLEVILPDAQDPAGGSTEYVIDLGAAFEKQGYDWSAEDLRDIEIQVGFAQVGVTLTVQEWVHDDQYHEVEI